MDKKHELIRKFVVTLALAHDRDVLDNVLDGKIGKKIGADSVYRSGKKSMALKRKDYDNRKCSKRNHPLTVF